MIELGRGSASGRMKIPVLLYHSFCSDTDKEAGNFTVTFDRFREQMDYLHKNGYAAVSLEKFFEEQEYWSKDEPKSEAKFKDTRKKVVLSFDDGNVSNYFFALPLLKEFGFTATFFVTVNDIGKTGRMDWTMIYDLSRAGMDIGSHGMSHSFFPGLAPYVLLNEFVLSKQVLEKYTRKRVNFVSIPHGFYNRQILAIARDAGFKSVCVSDAGYMDMDKELFLVRRYTMRKKYRLAAFKSIIQGKPAVFLNLKENVRSGLRHGLGYQVYDRLRRWIGPGRKRAVEE